MKRILFAAICSLVLASCGNEPNAELEKLKAEKEAIEREAASKDSMINSFMESLNDIEENLSQVKQKQGAIATTAKSDQAELQGSAKDRINEDINFINDLMEENKRKLANLQTKLKNTNVKLAEFEKMIARLTEQMAERDAEIVSLKEQLAAMNIQITERDAAIATLQTESAGKTQTIEQQNARINTAYYAVGTFKELRDNKVVNKEGGFLGIGKKRMLSSDFNQDYFTQIDISKTTSIPINAKDAKVITNHPSSSYKLDMDKKTVRSLIITNPESFWRSSKYLVVTVDR